MIYIQQVVRVRRRLLQGRGDEDFGGSVGRSFCSSSASSLSAVEASDSHFSMTRGGGVVVVVKEGIH